MSRGGIKYQYRNIMHRFLCNNIYIRAQTHKTDAKELEATKADCFIACVVAKKLYLNAPQRLQATVD